MLEIGESQLATIKKILREHIPGCEVRAFGSRVSVKAKSYSDLDLVVVGPEKIARRKMVLLKEAFEESDLPFRIDLLDWHKISDNFKKIIENKYQIIQQP